LLLNVGLCAAIVIVAVTTVAVALSRPGYDRMADLSVYLGGAQAVSHHHPLYSYAAANGDPFNYPPFALLPFLVLVHLPLLAVRLLWQALCLTAVGLIAAVLVRRWPQPLAAPRRTALLITLGLLVSAPVQSDLRFGQISVLIVALAFADAAEATPARWRGALIGVAAAIKVTPLLFVLYLLLARRWRDAARAGAAYAAATALGWLVLPADSRTFFTSTQFAVSRVGDLASLGNQSINGVLLRSGIPGPAQPLVWLLLVAVIVAIALRRGVVLRAAGLTAPAAAMVGCATLAASPISWTHHQVWSVIAAMLLLATTGPVSRVAGVVALLILTVSIVDVVQVATSNNAILFLAANARAAFTALLCVLGFGAFRRLATGDGRAEAPSRDRRVFRPSLAALTVGIIAFLLIPLPEQLARTVRPVQLDSLPAALINYEAGFAGRPYCARLPCGPHDGACPDLPSYDLPPCDPQSEKVVTPYDLLLGGLPVNYTIDANSNGGGVADGVVSKNVVKLQAEAAPGGEPINVPLTRTVDGTGIFEIAYANQSSLQLFAFGADGKLICECGARLRGETISSRW
jgi:alpha-1,2-mannosyltransferase